MGALGSIVIVAPTRSCHLTFTAMTLFCLLIVT